MKIRRIFISLILLILSSIFCSLLQQVFWPASIIPKAKIITSPALLMFALFWAPIFEEFLFRDLLLPIIIKISNKLSLPSAKWIGVIGSASFFAFYHYPQTYLLPYFINGMIYGWLKLKNKDYRSSIIAHILYNLSVSLPLFI